MISEKTVQIGEKGQITIPKAVRDYWGVHPNDLIRMTMLPSGLLMAHTIKKIVPEDRIFSTVSRMPKINADKLWKEVESERELER